MTKNECKIMMSTGALEKDKKTFKAALEKMILMMRNSAVYIYKESGSDNNQEKRFASVFSAGEIMEMQNVLKNLIADADKNANDNLLVTRLAIELTACIRR